MKCPFQASNADELNLREGEQLELIGDGDGDGWVRVRKLPTICAPCLGSTPHYHVETHLCNYLLSPGFTVLCVYCLQALNQDHSIVIDN